MDNYSLSDIRAVTDNDGMFGGNGLWFLALLFLFGGGFGGYGAGRGNVATTEDLASGFNFSALQGKTNDILAAVNNNNQVLGNAICQLGYQNAQHYASLSQQLSECCCATQRAVDSVKFDMANYSASTNAAITAGTQKVLDAITGNRMADMQNQINQLQLQAALCGIPRTNPYGYGIYAYPTCTPTCGTCNGAF